MLDLWLTWFNGSLVASTSIFSGIDFCLEMEKRTGQKPREVIGWKRQRQEDNRQREGGEERQEGSMFYYFQT